MSRAPRAADARRDWGSDDSGTPILHVDMDAFFAEVELLDRPELRGRPVIVGAQHRGVVLSATYEARAFGVRSAMPMASALALCPGAVVLRPQRDRYAQVSRELMSLLASVTPVIEPVSVDEAFLDVSGARRRLGGPLEIAGLLRRRIREELGLPASVGVAGTKLVAKLASGHAKPDGLLLVPQAATVDFLHSLPVGALWGVGERSAERLAGRGIRTVADLAHAPRTELESVLGRTAGMRLHDLAWGRDPRAVEPTREVKSVGVEVTFEEDLLHREQVVSVLHAHAEKVASTLRARGFLARSMTLKIRRGDLTTLTRSHTLSRPTDLARDLRICAWDLFGTVPLGVGGVRLVGLRAEGLVTSREATVQESFDDLDAPDWRGAEYVMDEVRARYGDIAVTTGSLLRPAATAAAIRDIS